MAKKIQLFLSYPWFIFLILFTIGGIIYLPKIGSFGFYKDDWYLMYDALTKGPDFFTTIFATDRPARAPLQASLYYLFKDTLIYYHFSAFFFRVLGSLFFWVILRMINPGLVRLNVLSAILFLVYPGFLSQPNAVDFQAHIVSLCLAMMSIALSLQAITETRIPAKYFFTFLSVILTWSYLGLMEYFIGMEVFRFIMIGWIVWKKERKSWWEKIRSTIIVPVLLLAGPLGFLSWRLFLFEGGRKATDITSQLASFFSNPLLVGIRWLVQLFQDAFKLLVSAWVIPFNNLAFDLRLRDQLQSVVIGILVGTLVYLLLKYSTDNDEFDNSLMLVGLVAVFGGIFPVILANRSINFTDYSRYTLPAMAGGIFVIAGIINLIKHRTIKNILILILCISAGMTHFGNAVQYSEQTTATNNFWWQVTWRVPGFNPNTTLIVDYPNAAIQEDYFIWGPANLIYKPGHQVGAEVIVPINALVLDQNNVLKVLVGKGEVSQLRRGNVTSADLSTVLVVSQPASNACVRVIDGLAPELSEGDRLEITTVANKSILSMIDLTTGNVHPPTSFFGSEPYHGWCYFYQKATLARQQGDWQKVIDLYEKSLSDGFYPSDKVEWLPLLQAYVKFGEVDKIKPYISILAESPFIQKQACELLLSTSTDPSDIEWITNAFCK